MIFFCCSVVVQANLQVHICNWNMVVWFLFLSIFQLWGIDYNHNYQLNIESTGSSRLSNLLFSCSTSGYSVCTIAYICAALASNSLMENMLSTFSESKRQNYATNTVTSMHGNQKTKPMLTCTWCEELKIKRKDTPTCNTC